MGLCPFLAQQYLSFSPKKQTKRDSRTRKEESIEQKKKSHCFVYHIRRKQKLSLEMELSAAVSCGVHGGFYLCSIVCVFFAALFLLVVVCI